MDLGIKGRRAIVCAGSRGLGRGCAASLARNGADLVINGREPAPRSRRRAQAIRAETGVHRRDVGRRHQRAPQCRPR